MSRAVSLLVVAIFLAAASLASAELVTLRGGGVLSVQGYHEDGDSAILVLRSGGVVVCRRDQVVAVGPDEVPRPLVSLQMAALPAGRIEVPYGDAIERLSAQHGVDARLVHAIVRVESGYRPDALSRRGAMGLMQLMPGTANRFGVVNPYDPLANLDGGIRYLQIRCSVSSNFRSPWPPTTPGSRPLPASRASRPSRRPARTCARCSRWWGRAATEQIPVLFGCGPV